MRDNIQKDISDSVQEKVRKKNGVKNKKMQVKEQKYLEYVLKKRNHCKTEIKKLDKKRKQLCATANAWSQKRDSWRVSEKMLMFARLVESVIMDGTKIQKATSETENKYTVKYKDRIKNSL